MGGYLKFWMAHRWLYADEYAANVMGKWIL